MTRTRELTYIRLDVRQTTALADALGTVADRVTGCTRVAAEPRSMAEARA